MLIEISKSLERRFTRVANRSGRKLPELANGVLLQYVEDSEDVFEAERILRRVRSGREKTFTLEQVTQRLGLDD